MRGQAVLFILATSAIACGPQVEVPEPEVRLATCGQDGPVKLLSVEGLLPRGSRMFGDRLLVYFFDPARFGSPDSWESGSETWLVDPCGGNERRIARDHWFDLTAGELVGCEEEKGNILWLDPDDGYALKTLFEGVDCEVTTTPHGWVARRASDDVLLIRRTLGTDEPPEVLPATATFLPWSCRIRTSNCDFEHPTLQGPAVYVLDGDDRIVRVELEGEPSVEVVGEAAWARQSADARWLFWEDDGTVHVRDLRWSEDILSYDGAPPLFTLLPHRYVFLRSNPPQLFDLERGEAFELPTEIHNLFSRPGGHTLLFAPDQSYAWNEQTTDLVPLGPPDARCPREWFREGYARTDCERGGNTLWLTPYDGSEPQRIATGVSSSAFMLVPSGVVWSTTERPIDSLSEETPLQTGELRLAEGPDTSILLDRNALLQSFLVIDGDIFYATYDDDEPAALWRTATE